VIAEERIGRIVYLESPLAKTSDPRTLLRKGGEPANEQMFPNQSEWRALHATR
jgi:hypothetical protein